MKTATINFKTDVYLKDQAQHLAVLIGIPLGSLLHAYLKEFVATQEVFFSHNNLKKLRTPEQILQNLDEDDREKLRTLLNRTHLKEMFEKEKSSPTRRMI